LEEVVVRISTSPMLLPTIFLTILISKQELYYTCVPKQKIVHQKHNGALARGSKKALLKIPYVSLRLDV
jgi:hypothetical protein